MWSWNLLCHPNSIWLIVENVFTDALYPRMTDAKFFDWGPNLFVVQSRKYGGLKNKIP
jgi:hypothetical protein